MLSFGMSKLMKFLDCMDKKGQGYLLAGIGGLLGLIVLGAVLFVAVMG